MELDSGEGMVEDLGKVDLVEEMVVDLEEVDLVEGLAEDLEEVDLVVGMVEDLGDSMEVNLVEKTEDQDLMVVSVEKEDFFFSHQEEAEVVEVRSNNKKHPE